MTGLDKLEHGHTGPPKPTFRIEPAVSCCDFACERVDLDFRLLCTKYSTRRCSFVLPTASANAVDIDAKELELAGKRCLHKCEDVGNQFIILACGEILRRMYAA